MQYLGHSYNKKSGFIYNSNLLKHLYFIKIFLLFFSYSCPYFTPTALPCPIQSLLPKTIPTPLSLSMGPLYMFLNLTLPVSPFPSGYCQSGPCFHACGFISLLSLFCLLDSSYRWDHMVSVFHCLAYLTQHSALQFHPCCHESKSSFFLSTV